MKQCKKCGKIHPDDYKFCGECGANLENRFTYICNHCGRIYDDGSIVCPKCHAVPDVQLPPTTAAKAKELQDTAVQKAGELKEKAAVAAAVATGAASTFLKTASEKASEAGQKATELAKTASEKTAETKEKVVNAVQNTSETLNKEDVSPTKNKLLLAIIAAVLIVGSIGGYFLFARSSDDKKSVAQSQSNPTQQTTKPGESPASKTAEKPAAPVQQFSVNQKSPRDAFISFHAAITNRQLADAYNILSPDYQNFVRGYDNFARGYATTLQSDVVDLNSIHEDSSSAVLTYKLKAEDQVESGKAVQYYIGKAKLLKINGQWRIDSTEARKASQESKVPVNLATITAKGEVNLRAYPSTNANSVGVVREGDWVEILETGTCSDSTAAIVISDDISFGSGGKYTRLSKGMAIKIVKDNGKEIICRVNVDNRPTDVRFAPNHLVKLYGTTWYKVSSNGYTGWIYSNYARKK